MLPGNKPKTITFKIKDYPNIQFKAGTMDRERLNGCYLEIRGTIESKMENHLTNMFRFKKKMSGTIDKFLSNSFLSKNYLLTQNVADTFEVTGFSFSTFEFTFFPKRETTIKELTNELNQMIKVLYTNNIENNLDITFHKNLYKGKR